MFKKWEKYSYADQKNRISRIRIIVLKIALVIIIYMLLTNLFFPTIVMESASMRPSIYPGDRFVFSAFSLRRMLPSIEWENVPYKHGAVVMVDLADKSERGILITILEKIIRFWTAGHVGLPQQKDAVFIKRIIGLPGDTVSMVNYVIQIHPADSQYSFTEYEVSDRHYQVNIPQVPALWDEAIPFSGNLPPVTLKADECFLLSDDRGNTNDSRTCGPVKLQKIAGVALFRYWPLYRIGSP